MKIDVEGFEAEALAGLTQPVAGAVVRIHHDPARRRARLPRALRDARLCPLQCGAGREPDAGACRLAERGCDRPLARRAADGGEFRGCVCDALACVFRAAAARDRGTRRRRSRGRRAERERADAVRREGQRLSQARPRPSCAASRSRRCIRTISAPSWSTARPSTCTTARISRPRRSSPRSRGASRSSRRRNWQLIGHHHPELLAQDHRAGARRRPGRDRRAAACSSGPARRTAPRKCWCSIRRTATGARARCRRRT